MNPTLKKLGIVWLWSIGAVVAFVLLVMPTPQIAAGANATAEPTWSVPRLPTKVDVSPAVANLAKGILWGGQLASTTDLDSKALVWRMAAIVGAGKDRVVIVQFGDERSLPLKVGDKFPDGTPLTEIKDNGVCVLLNGKKRFLPMPGQTAALVW